MSDKPSGRGFLQEKLIRQFSEHSMGAPFIFAPDNYRKGNATREPADLAWACNGCLILMCMQSSDATAEEMFDHNFKQLQGFLRAWFNNSASLTGKNDFQQFSILPSDFPHIVLLSIVGGPAARSEYHCEVIHECRRKGWPVTLCATLAEEVISTFSILGGTTIDLLSFIDALRLTRQRLGEPEAVALINGRFEWCVRHAAELAGQSVASKETMSAITNQLIILRNEIWPKEPDTTGGYLSILLNDVSWFDLYTIVWFVKSASDRLDLVKAGEFGDKQFIGQLSLGMYLVLVEVNRLSPTNRIAAGGNRFGDLVKARPECSPLYLIFSKISTSFMTKCMFHPTGRIGPSQTESLLDGLRDSQLP